MPNMEWVDSSMVSDHVPFLLWLIVCVGAKVIHRDALMNNCNVSELSPYDADCLSLGLAINRHECILPKPLCGKRV